jgi:anthranilate synthase component 1
MVQTLVEETKPKIDGRVAIVRELAADLETPISVYLKLRGGGPSFLLESVTGGEQVARYSFIGVRPRRVFVDRPSPTRNGLDGKREGIIEVLRETLAEGMYEPVAGLPRLAGGLVGYLGYEAVRGFEPSTGIQAHGGLPEAIFLQADTLVAFDHAFGRLLLIGIASEEDELAVRAELDAIEQRLRRPMPPFATGNGDSKGAANPLPAATPLDRTLHSNMTQAEFEAAVRLAKEHIAAGDIFQAVLSQRLSRKTTAEAFDIYRALRRLNPSPYMFFFDFDTLAGGDEPLYVLGASPEMHARLEGRTAKLRPIAGTRRRGATPAEDAALEADLLADPKERAEHVMLVDLGRNDLGRVCEYGSVRVPESLVVERYSHVMHIVSQVQGRLRDGLDAFDLLQATFPAGTVSGAPKVRAMQLIRDLEPGPRGVYAGVVGYFSYDGAMDTCIAIRTMVMRGRTVHIQAGAGIVADSIPENEYQETLNKARALAAAIEAAEQQAGG